MQVTWLGVDRRLWIAGILLICLFPIYSYQTLPYLREFLPASPQLKVSVMHRTVVVLAWVMAGIYWNRFWPARSADSNIIAVAVVSIGVCTAYGVWLKNGNDPSPDDTIFYTLYAYSCVIYVVIACIWAAPFKLKIIASGVAVFIIVLQFVVDFISVVTQFYGPLGKLMS
jgi:hypothetical protein